MCAISSTARENAGSLAFDGLLNPVIFRTNWREAARTLSGVTGRSKLKSVSNEHHYRVVPTIDNESVFALS